MDYSTANKDSNDALTYDKLLEAMKKIEEMPPIPIGLEVSPELHAALMKNKHLPVDGLYVLQGLPVETDYILTGNQYRVKYNKPPTKD